MTPRKGPIHRCPLILTRAEPSTWQVGKSGIWRCRDVQAANTRRFASLFKSRGQGGKKYHFSHRQSPPRYRWITPVRRPLPNQGTALTTALTTNFQWNFNDTQRLQHYRPSEICWPGGRSAVHKSQPMRIEVSIPKTKLTAKRHARDSKLCKRCTHRFSTQ